jgi:hypothetical protein
MCHVALKAIFAVVVGDVLIIADLSVLEIFAQVFGDVVSRASASISFGPVYYSGCPGGHGLVGRTTLAANTSPAAVFYSVTFLLYASLSELYPPKALLNIIF